MSGNMKIWTLDNRRVLYIRGRDNEHFLHNLITTDVEHLEQGTISAGALLTPQGKVMFDFLIARTVDGFLIDIDQILVEAFKKRLLLHRLRADVYIVESNESVGVIALQFDSSLLQSDSAFIDKRFKTKEKIIRLYGPLPFPANQTINTWTQFRIDNAIAESGHDFIIGDVLPHDINYDQIGGLSLHKGCYIGQEVVSRMHHRGTARRRLLIVEADEILPASKMPDVQSEITSGGRIIGTLGSVEASKALGLVRIDRVKTALDKGEPILLDNLPLTLSIPPYATFTYPETADE